MPSNTGSSQFLWPNCADLLAGQECVAECAAGYVPQDLTGPPTAECTTGQWNIKSEGACRVSVRANRVATVAVLA
jgi:hypothetical protein